MDAALVQKSGGRRVHVPWTTAMSRRIPTGEILPTEPVSGRIPTRCIGISAFRTKRSTARRSRAVFRKSAKNNARRGTTFPRSDIRGRGGQPSSRYSNGFFGRIDRPVAAVRHDEGPAQIPCRFVGESRRDRRLFVRFVDVKSTRSRRVAYRAHTGSAHRLHGETVDWTEPRGSEQIRTAHQHHRQFARISTRRHGSRFRV